MDALAIAALLATANKALLDYLIAPLRRRYPDADLWWIDYVALATGGCIAWFAGVNVFASLIIHEIIGRVLTALLVGGGTALLNAVMAISLPPSGRSRTRGW